MKVVRAPRSLAASASVSCVRVLGFSLVELMVTLAVAGILAAIAIPNLRSYVQNVRRDSVIDGLVASLHYTRNQALNLDQTASLCAGTTAASGTACPTGGVWNNGWEVITLPASAATATTLTTNVRTAVGSAPTVTTTQGNLFIAFTPLGLLSTTGATAMAVPNEIFVVCDARGIAYARAVEVNATGYIQSSPTPGTVPGGTAIPAANCP
jgi:type IV fimbrial biogenesis protein FimT